MSAPPRAPAARSCARLGPLQGAVAVAWALVMLDATVGPGVLHRLASVPDGPGAVAVLVAGWTVMTGAMMVPGALPAARHVAANTLRSRSTVSWFVLGYVVVWVLLGGAAGVLLGVAAAHATGVAVPAAVLLAAGAWQLGPVKRAALRHCRGGAFLPATGRRADRAAGAFGARHGLACVAGCGPLMLVMLVAPGGHLVWTVVLTVLVHAEKARGLGPRLTVPTAVAAAMLGVGLLVVGWLPPGAPAPLVPGHHS